MLQKLCVTMGKHPGGFNCHKSLRVGCWNVRRSFSFDLRCQSGIYNNYIYIYLCVCVCVCVCVWGGSVFLRTMLVGASKW